MDNTLNSCRKNMSYLQTVCRRKTKLTGADSACMSVFVVAGGVTARESESNDPAH